ncbi:MAG: hypothetical protein AAF660_15150 [Pseudomonadota bacterium]
MTDNKNQFPPAVLIAIGMVFGLAGGIMLDNLAFGIGAGVGIGAIGAVILNALQK